MSYHNAVPFNDLSRIHIPLLDEFKEELGRLVETSSLVLGSEVAEFEKELAVIEDCDFAIGVNNGTSAIELSLRALGIGNGDEVITTAFTFVATCFSIIQTGATPVLVDIDPMTGLMDPAKLKLAITSRTKAVVFVTLHGRVESLIEIQEICKVHELSFVIDAAQSHLGKYDGVAQSKFCDVATLSFYPGKNLGALGEGGAVLTNSQEIRDKIVLMRDWGAAEKYNHTVWGGNYRLESIQASFLKIKLREISNWTIERQKIASNYLCELNPKLLMKPISTRGSHVFHIFSIIVENRESFCNMLTKSHMGFGFHYPKAIHQQPAYQGKVSWTEALKNSEWLASRTVSIPIFPKETEEEIELVIKTVNEAYKQTCN
jgi:dTDP-4-amino-4,6-dideoxygalactose transaminase